MTNGAKYIGNDWKEYKIMEMKKYEIMNNWRAGIDRLKMKLWWLESWYWLAKYEIMKIGELVLIG